MEPKQYYDTIQKVAELVDKGQDLDAATDLLKTIIESDLPDMDRAIMSINMAVVCDKMGHVDHALAWYDHGISLEVPHMRFLVRTSKAAYLASIGKKAEAVAIYQKLLREPFLTTPEREDLKNHLAAVQSR